MAERDENRDDLTEERSQFRLEEYRRKGNVAQSRELTGLIAFLAAGVVVYVTGPIAISKLIDFMREVFQTDLSSRLNLADLSVSGNYIKKGMNIAAMVVFPVALAAAIAGVLVGFAQVGSLFTTEPLSPDPNKVNPLQGLQRMISKRQWIDNGRFFLKVIAVVWVAYGMIKRQLFESPRFLGSEPLALGAQFTEQGKSVFFAMGIVLLIFALVDLWYQRWEYDKSLRLTKPEAKQEMKEREGDPLIRARVRSIQREMSRRRMMEAVKKADVVITNPTHFAVALVYDRQKMSAPKVVAKGTELVAKRIREIAMQSGVTIVENPPLARTLFKSVKIGQMIPRSLYQAVADVLTYVYRLKNRKL